MSKLMMSLLMMSFSAIVCASPKGEVVKQKASETVIATKEYTIEQKEEFTNGLKQELRELDQNIAVMRSKASTKSDQVSSEVKAQLASLDQQRTELNNKINKLSTASSSAWSEMRSGIQSAYKEIKSSYNKASEKFNSP